MFEQMPPLGYVMGWHAAHARGEKWHLKQASQNGLTVLCSSTSSNFSFHRHVEARKPLKPPHNKEPEQVTVEDKVYITFVFSDGDSLNWFSRGHGYQWQKRKGSPVTLGWEIQPLLSKLAPAMLEHFYITANEKDRFIASASGIGYTYPDAMPKADLQRLLEESRKYLKAIGMKTLTVLPFEGVGDQRAQMYNKLLGDPLHGIMEGYWVKKPRQRRSMSKLTWTPIVLPPFEPKERTNPTSLAKRLRKMAESRDERPLFLPVHIPCHRMKYNNVVALAKKLESPALKILGPDAFYIAMRKARER